MMKNAQNRTNLDIDARPKQVTAIYARTSTHLQATGLQSQLLALKGYCEAKGISDCRIYTDAGVSGAKASRPGLDQMLADAKAGLIQNVVTYSLSRLSRSTSHLLQTLEQLKALGVGFISVSEAIDLSTPMGLMVVTVLGAVAQLEREITVERVRTGLVNARSKGKKLGRPTSVNRDLVKALVIQHMTYRQISKLTGASHWIIREVSKQVACSEPTTSEQSTLVG
jgi:DNA invertase Pin-like site-specific DNA recombinase